MRNIISIISEQLTPNFIFIKEIANHDDRLIFISTKKMQKKLDTLKQSLQSDDEAELKTSKLLLLLPFNYR